MVKPPVKPPVNICYVGSDTGFFQNIIQRFKSNYAHINWQFPILKPNQMPEKMFLALMDYQPKIVYIDFCEEKERALRLAELASIDPFFHEIPLVGFVEKKEDTLSCLGAGADFIYVKGGEFHDLVYAPMNIAFPKQVIKPKFATGKISQEVELIDDFRVGFITPTHIHVEGNFYLEEGTIVHFKNHIPKKNVPSENFEVQNRSEQNLYYDFNYSYDLEFKYVDPPELTDEKEDDAAQIEDEAERVKALKQAKEDKRQRLAEYQESLKRAQKKHKEWVIHELDDTKKEKKTKLLIVDESMRAFTQIEEDTLSKTPYSVHFQTQLDEGFTDLDRQRPVILAYQMMGEYGPDVAEEFALAQERINAPEGTQHQPHEDPDKEKLIQQMVEDIPVREKEEMSYVSLLVQLVKEMDNYAPIVVLFGCYFQSSKALQESFQYPMLVTHAENLTLDVCLNLAKIYETRQEEKLQKLVEDKVKAMKAQDPQKYRRLTATDFKEKKLFVKKSNPLSFGSIQTHVVLASINESEITFKSERALPIKTYRLKYPLDLSVHLVPIEEGKDFIEDKGIKLYRGIIHSISETDKKQLRQQVNEVFFEPLKEKREKEKAEFDELNAKVLKDKEEQKMSEEEKERLAQEILGVDGDTSNPDEGTPAGDGDSAPEKSSDNPDGGADQGPKEGES